MDAVDEPRDEGESVEVDDSDPMEDSDVTHVLKPKKAARFVLTGPRQKPISTRETRTEQGCP